MKSFDSDILAELKADPAGLVPIIKISLPVTTMASQIYLAARDIDFSELTGVGRSIQPRVKAWSSFGREIDWKNSDIIQAVWGMDLINLGMGDDWESFVSQIASAPITRGMVELRLYPKH